MCTGSLIDAPIRILLQCLPYSRQIASPWLSGKKNHPKVCPLRGVLLVSREEVYFIASRRWSWNKCFTSFQIYGARGGNRRPTRPMCRLLTCIGKILAKQSTLTCHTSLIMKRSCGRDFGLDTEAHLQLNVAIGSARSDVENSLNLWPIVSSPSSCRFHIIFRAGRWNTARAPEGR